MKKFNMIDYVIFLMILLGVFFLSKTVFVKTSDVWVEIIDDKNTMTGEIDPVQSWETENIEVGSTIFNDVGGEMANVIEVERVPWRDGSKMKINMTVKMHLVYDSKQRLYLFNANPLRIGDRIYLNFGKNGFWGKVKNIYSNQKDLEESKNIKKTKATIKVKLKDYEILVLEAIKTIKGVLKVEISPGSETSKYDAVVTIQLLNVACSLNICYDQNYQPLVVGNSYWMNNGVVGFENETTIIDRKIENGD
jgi:hypothetical protein